MAEAAVTTRLKKLINTPETEVKDAMAGMAAAHSDLIRVEYDPNVIIRKDAPKKGKVGLVSGGPHTSPAAESHFAVRRGRPGGRRRAAGTTEVAVRPDGAGDQPGGDWSRTTDGEGNRTVHVPTRLADGKQVRGGSDGRSGSNNPAQEADQHAGN